MGEIMLKLTDVSKTYGEGEAAVHALKKVDLEIEKKDGFQTGEYRICISEL